MLQQTQVSRGIEFYNRFLAKFPTLSSLAKASWRNVLPVWRGLGYYRRGENLLRTAKLLVSEYKGKFPQDKKSLQQLPGIGPYTAAAIVSFAFDQPEPAIDTNVKRVLGRFYGCPEVGVGPRAVSIFRKHKKQSAELNHALMDLGSALCTSRKALCEECPLSKGCDYYQSGKRDVWAAQSARKTKRKRSAAPSIVDVGCACIHREGKYLFAKRIAAKGGKWEFPGGKREKGESIRSCLKREIQEELGVEVSVRPPFLVEEFTEKNFTWRLHFCRCRILRGREQCREHEKLEWVTPDDFSNYPMPKENRRALSKL
ncbi:MAG: A/G-specific adenine glycosylase [Bdellovibrionales bacterium]|nr:A/G-specific adenine glycosylase [Bdellovibrionales bacterium]